MDLGFLPKLRYALAEHLTAQLEPSAEAQALLSPGLTAAGFIQALADAELHSEALRFLALGLPRREAVWWACAVRARLLPPELPAKETAAWNAAEAWVYEPTEANRRAAYAPAEALKFETAGAYAALGTFWSGGSLAPPDSVMVVPPGDALTGSAIGAALLLCCVPGPAKTIGERHAQVLTIGADIANGGSGRTAA
ncbi:hypothetical protein V5F77_07160 [Xanthobacter sp. DSM 24535]|uniref:DUF6931 family protein n=1 Tax=Roseixanthobacter psychrophilus TaxID=3119917 RepID=UPI00372B9A4F